MTLSDALSLMWVRWMEQLALVRLEDGMGFICVVIFITAISIAFHRSINRKD